MERLDTNSKIIGVLKKLDEVLSRNNCNQFQKRLHNIYKTMLSIEKHEDCHVSNFNIEGENSAEDCTPLPDLHLPREKETGFQSYASSFNLNWQNPNFLSLKPQLMNNNDTRRGSEFSVSKLNLDELFNYIESQLNCKTANNDTTVTDSSSSSEEESDDRKEINEIHNMQIRFKNIEGKLKEYLKEQSHRNIFQNHTFDSFLNESKIKTPLSKVSPHQNTTPVIIKNFFEDKVVLEAAKKRYSMRGDNVLINRAIGNLEEENLKCKSNFERISIKSIGKEEQTDVSNFNSDFNTIQQNTQSNFLSNSPSFNFIKRDSIFGKDKYNFLLHLENSNLMFEERLSEKSEDSNESFDMSDNE
jgi:hypothetical protein